MSHYHFAKRPHPKPNPNAIRINKTFSPLSINDDVNQNNSHNQNINVETGDSENRINQNRLGGVGEVSTLAWLYCDLQNWGKTIIRQGNRSELDPTKPQIWVFCPLLKRRNPHDRILVENCKKCPHFKGMSEPITQKSNDITTNYKINFVPAKKHQPKIGFSKEEIERGLREKEEEDKKWKAEEKMFFPKSPKKREKKVDKI